MRIIECIQGSPEWYAAKCGIPTSSNFDKIVTTKGEPSKQREKYLYRLAGETITGISEESYQNEAMLRGKEMEFEARKLYQLIENTKVKEIGFCLERGFGCSPDGFVGKYGLLEIKCPLLSAHVNYLLDKSLPIDYWQQLQGQLLVTDRNWVDVMSYYLGIKPLIIRVKREKKFISVLEVELKRFCAELKQVVKKIK